MKNKLFMLLLCLVLIACMVSCGEDTEAKDTTGSADTTASADTTGSSDTTGGSDTTATPGTTTPGTTTPGTTDTSTPPDTSAPDTEPGYDTIDPEELSAAQQSAFTWCSNAISAAEKGEILSASADTKKLADDWSKVYKVISNEMLRIYDEFTRGKVSYGTLECFMKSCSNIANAKGLSEGYVTLASTRRSDVDFFEQAKSFAEAGNYKKATMAIAKISKSDFTMQASAKALITSSYDKAKEGITDAVTEFMVRYDLAEGKAYLEAMRGYGLDSHIDAQAARLEEYRVYQDVELESVDLNETLENIYTHCLIAFPEINFASKTSYRACGPDCLTPYEFKFLLQSLYDRGYVIIDANLVYNAEKDAPNYTLQLPKGKKPVIFTFDDVTYDSRKMGKGMVDKLIVDEFGYVCTYTKHKDGTEVISYDNELFPILDAFVRENPEFTFRGARGTLFFTGFDGICGYRTQSEPVDNAEAALKLDRQKEIAQAKVVIEAMREEGWTFGSHGYNHSHMPKITAASFRKEIDMWREEVGAIVGDTGLFCWPYGHHTEGEVNIRKNAQHKYLFDSGFTFMFGCGSGRYLANELDGLGIFSDRKGVTGNVLLYIAAEYRTYVRDYPYLFDTEKIWDPLRLQYKDWLLSSL